MKKPIVVILLTASIIYNILGSFTFYRSVNINQRGILELQSKIDSLNIELNYCSDANKLNYASCQELQAECDKWNNYAIRMKRICGIPDTINLSYKVKCKYSIDTRRLVGKHAIFE